MVALGIATKRGEIMTLEEARAEIAAIDREMAALFERRMAAA